MDLLRPKTIVPLFLLTAVTALPGAAFGAACSAAATGNWSAGATWSGCTGPGGIPAAIDTITIPSVRVVTLDVDATVAGLTFAAPGTNNGLTHSGASALTVNGPVTFTQPTTNNRNNSWLINAGSATVTGLITFNGATTTTSRISRITITTGQLNALSGITFTGSASATKVIDISGGAGRLNLKGALTIPANSCTLTAGSAGSVFSFADTVIAQTVRFFTAGAYERLALNNTSASGVTLGAAVSATNVTADVLVESGVFKNGAFAIVGGTGDIFQVSDGATFEMSGTSAFPTGFTTFTLGAQSRVRYLQTTNPLTIASRTFGHLDLAPAGTATQRFPAGAFSVLGDLSVGNGTNAATADLNTNGTTLSVGGAVVINANGTLTADNTNGMNVGGDWTNNGTFTHNSSTVTFNGVAAQDVNNVAKAFGKMVLDNASSAGLTFSAAFSAAQLSIDTAGLASAATAYFDAGSTFTVTSLSLLGTAAFPTTLRSTTPGAYWYLANSGSREAGYVRVQDSNAAASARLLVDPAGEDLGHNVNWAVGLFPPASLSASGSGAGSLTFSWPASAPTGDSYTLQASADASFNTGVVSSNTANLSATTSGLLLNTTYFARVASVIAGATSAWTATTSSATAAGDPDAAVETWPEVNITSITVAWSVNGNPAATRYQVDFSPLSDFSAQVASSSTLNAGATFAGLVPETRYYARVKAIGHSGNQTPYLLLGSTATLAVNAPPNLQATSATTGALSASWSIAQPPGESYMLQASADASFITGVVSSNTANLSATTVSLLVNTTYHLRVGTLISGSTSPWSSSVTTATLADVPAAAGATWPVVHVTSLTVAWAANGNPASVTRYDVQLSTVNTFLSGEVFTSSTYNLSAILSQLDSGATYYARVRGVNHSNIGTAFLSLGSTVTRSVPVPKNLAFTAALTNQLSASWTASTPAGDTYDFRVSTDPAFGGTVVSSSTANLFATPAATLSVNTTYYGAVRAVISGTSYPYTAYETTSTLANAPATSGATWSDVDLTSLTVTWDANGNPAAVTRYDVQLSTRADFVGAGATTTSTLSSPFSALVPDSTYYARVKAVNHAGIFTAYTSLGSTVTSPAHAPANLVIDEAQIDSVSASWSEPIPAGETYTLQAGTSAAFGGTLVSSVTAGLAATVSSLAVNTTYHLRVSATLSGSQSPWSTSVSSATLAAIPATAVSTWSALSQSGVTMSWEDGGNPAGTQYVAEISDAVDFISGDVISSTTITLDASFGDLLTDTDYFGRVKALNQSGIETGWLTLGSTHTIAPNTCNAVATGNWSAGATWSNCTGPGGIPSATDAIVINSARVVTLDVDATVAGLTFAAPGTSNGLTHSGTRVLTVNGPVRFNQPTTSTRNNTWTIGAGSATVAGLITFAGTSGTTSRISRITITSGQLGADGGITFTGSASATKQIVMSGGAGRLNLKGALTIPANSCTLTAGTAGSVFNYADDVAGQTVRFFTAGAYDNVAINNTSPAGATLAAAVTATNVAEDIMVESGVLKNGGFAIVGGAGDIFQVNDGATFEMSGTSAFPTGFSTFTLGTQSRVVYRQTTNPLTVASPSFGHLDLMPAGTATQRFPAGAFDVAGDLTIGNGVDAGTADLNTNGTTLSVDGSVIINANATLTADNASGLTVGGDWTNAGAFTHNNSTVTFGGAAAQFVDNAGGAFGNVVAANGSTGGLAFSSDFSAAQLSLNTAALGSAATIYFTAGGTASVVTLSITGTAGNPATLRSTVDGAAWNLANSGGHIVIYARVKDSDASAGLLIRAAATSSDLGNNVDWDFGPPSTVADLAAVPGVVGRSIDLTWSAPGDAPGTAPLAGATFVIAYTSDTVFAAGSGWSPTANVPVGVYRIDVATSVAAGDACRVGFTGLLAGATYHFRLWTTDSAGGTSAISNGATTYAAPVISSITLSASLLNFGSLNPGATVVHAVPVTVTNRGNTSVDFDVSITDPVIWKSTPIAAGIDTFRLCGLFQDTLPAATDFVTGNDAVLTTTMTATITTFARDGGGDGEKGISVPPNASRLLWFRMEMPPLSTTADGQVIRLQVSPTE